MTSGGPASVRGVPHSFDDLLNANARHATGFRPPAPDGTARAGIGVVTCMDARIDPLAMLGLTAGDGPILRNPGGRVTGQVLQGLVLAVHLLGVERILVVPHTRCAVVTADEADLRDRVGRASGHDVTGETFGAVADQQAALHSDVERIRDSPLIPDRVAVGGFLYDVDTGRLQHLV